MYQNIPLSIVYTYAVCEFPPVHGTGASSISRSSLASCFRFISRRFQYVKNANASIVDGTVSTTHSQNLDALATHVFWLKNGIESRALRDISVNQLTEKSGSIRQRTCPGEKTLLAPRSVGGSAEVWDEGGSKGAYRLHGNTVFFHFHS